MLCLILELQGICQAAPCQDLLTCTQSHGDKTDDIFFSFTPKSTLFSFFYRKTSPELKLKFFAHSTV